MPINDAFMLPKQVRTMEQMADLLQTEQAELTQTSRTIAALEQQLTISTSTFLLLRHEAIYDLPSNPSESMAVRRVRLLGKLNTHGSTTVKSIREMVQIVTGCESDVIEHAADYRFDIIIHSQTFNEFEQMREMMRRIDEMKPAHLTYHIIHQVTTTSTIYTGIAARQGDRYRLAPVVCSGYRQNPVYCGIAPRQGDRYQLRPLSCGPLRRDPVRVGMVMRQADKIIVKQVTES